MITDTLDVLRGILVDKFGKDPAQVTPESTLESLQLDSMDTFEVLFAAEDAFSIKIPNDQIEIKTLADVVGLIDKFRAAKG